MAAIPARSAPFGGPAPRVSVIMPIYNVEAYLPRAMDSVLRQSFRSFELIAMDDGSTDGSGRIADEYAARDPRVRVIHGPNRGAPAARNAAMAEARGEYLYFMDSDDHLEADALRELVGLIERDGSQIAICGFSIDTYVKGDRFVRSNRSVPDAIYADRSSFRASAHRLLDANLLYTPWNKLFRATYLRERGVRFPDTFWDDFPFNLAAIRDVERVAVTSSVLYHFTRARADSETARYRSGMAARRLEEHRWLRELYAHWGIRSPEIDEAIDRRLVERALGCLENFASRDCDLHRAEKLREIRELIRERELIEAFASARPSPLMRLMLIPIRLRIPRLAYAEGVALQYMKRRFAGLYARLKAGRGGGGGRPPRLRG